MQAKRVTTESRSLTEMIECECDHGEIKNKLKINEKLLKVLNNFVKNQKSNFLNIKHNEILNKKRS